MKFLLYSICLFHFCIIAQEKINVTDASGKKQGKWVVFGKTQPGSCYKEDQKIEEGNYSDDMKSGLWTEYYCSGKIKSELIFVEGKPEGLCKTYYENGQAEEVGHWKNGHWLGEYTKFNSEGGIRKFLVFDQNGNLDPAHKHKFIPRKDTAKIVTHPQNDTKSDLHAEGAKSGKNSAPEPEFGRLRDYPDKSELDHYYRRDSVKYNPR